MASLYGACAFGKSIKRRSIDFATAHAPYGDAMLQFQISGDRFVISDPKHSEKLCYIIIGCTTFENRVFVGSEGLNKALFIDQSESKRESSSSSWHSSQPLVASRRPVSSSSPSIWLTGSAITDWFGIEAGTKSPSLASSLGDSFVCPASFLASESFLTASSTFSMSVSPHMDMLERMLCFLSPVLWFGRYLGFVALCSACRGLGSPYCQAGSPLRPSGLFQSFQIQFPEATLSWLVFGPRMNFMDTIGKGTS
ncbi:hypothetical protein NQ318_019161 [Aromia moschata]|uniref:Uncharacterized protein n=1 Tax=Aromia moschata TaxID=1265417 RepID=A0AAV8YSH9_9CUCU|nr:hypothetical protein NQ318_019161 [Aromia moschata]